MADTYFMPVPGPMDVANFNAALASTEGNIQLEPGVYEINATLHLGAIGKRMLGAGPGRTTIRASDASNLVWMFDQGASSAGWVFEEIIFDANHSNQASGSNGVFDLAARTFTAAAFRRCSFKDTGSFCVIAKGSSLTIDDCVFDTALTTQVALWGVTHVSIRNCIFRNYNVALGNNPAIQLNPSEDILIQGNSFINVGSNEFSVEAVGEVHSTNVRLLGNYFDGNAQLGGTGISGPISRSVISGNIFANGASFGHRNGIELAGEYVNITNNVINNGCVVLVGKASSPKAFEGNVVTGNIIIQTSSQESGPTPLSGIQCVSQKDFIISNNSIEFNISNAAIVQAGIYLGTVGDSEFLINGLVQGNMLRVNGTGGGSGNGIRLRTGVTAVDSYSRGLKIIGNTCDSFNNGITLQASPDEDKDTYLLIEGNDLRTCPNPIVNTPTGVGSIVQNNRGQTISQSFSTGPVTLNCNRATLVTLNPTAAITIDPPVCGYAGQVIEFFVTQGGTAFPITWNPTAFKKGADVGLAAGKVGSTSFRFDGTSWYQIAGPLTYN